MSNPSAERQLILLSAGIAVRRHADSEQIERIVAGVDWPQLGERLRLRRLLSVLGPRIVDLADGRTSENFAVTVEQAIVAARRQGAFLQMVSLRVMTALADAGIRSAALKGPLLGEAIYGDLGRRLSSDVDLLVPQEQLRSAVKVVRELGYSAPTDYVLACGLPQLHFGLVHERGVLPPVELHWRIHWYEDRFAHERLLPQTLNPQGHWRPALADELTSLLLFYARDGFIDLRLATDLSAWWDAYGADLSHRALEDALRAYPALEPVISAAVEAAARVTGLPAVQIIGDMNRLGLRERVAVRLANPNPHASKSQLYADMGLIDGLLAPRGGFGAFVRRQLLPPPEVRDEQARHKARRRRRSSVVRAAGTLARYGLTMTRLLRAPEVLH